MSFTPQDFKDVEARGLTREEAKRQLELLKDPPPPPVLERPCGVEDGILRLKPEEGASFIRLFNDAREEGRLSKFIPASGAATRMFKAVLSCLKKDAAITRESLEKRAAEGDADAMEAVQLAQNVQRLPFYEALKASVRKKGEDPDALLKEGRMTPWFRCLVSEEGLGLADLPKGLIPFHRLRSETRTALEEHLLESVDTLRDNRALCRLHFTVSPEHETPFRDKISEVVPRVEGSRHVKFDASLSLQKPSTDTISLDADGRPVRRSDGKLLFRPGGHGALLHNLQDGGGDVVFVKNIDNVPHESHPGERSHWDALLAGLLLDLQFHLFQRMTWLTLRPNDPRLLAEAEEFAFRRLNIHPPESMEAEQPAARRQWLLERLNRPLRVCAVIPNTGEPGGGPFWVRGKDGAIAPQIVESAQVSQDPAQKKIFRAATHFNPVHMVLGLKDRRGDPFDLHAFTDPDAVFTAEKSHEGRPIKVLERPGLWNGAMANWTTVFVEAPLSIFHPVKTVNDLLRPDHQPR